MQSSILGSIGIRTQVPPFNYSSYPPFLTSVNGYAFYLNAPPGTLTGPTETQSPSAQQTWSGVALTSTAGTFTPPTPKFQLVSTTDSTEGAVGTFNCTPTCPAMTLTNTTGTGHLLYLQSANLTASSYISSVSGGGTWVVPSQCQINLSGQGPLSCAYVLTSSSTSSITVTMGSSSVNGFLFSESLAHRDPSHSTRSTARKTARASIRAGRP